MSRRHDDFFYGEAEKSIGYSQKSLLVLLLMVMIMGGSLTYIFSTVYIMHA